MVLLVKLQHYRARQRYETTKNDLGERFTHAYSVLSISSNLRVTCVVPTRIDFDAVEVLGEYSRCDFQPSFRALKRLAPKTQPEVPEDG